MSVQNVYLNWKQTATFMILVSTLVMECIINQICMTKWIMWRYIKNEFSLAHKLLDFVYTYDNFKNEYGSICYSHDIQSSSWLHYEVMLCDVYSLHRRCKHCVSVVWLLCWADVFPAWDKWTALLAQKLLAGNSVTAGDGQGSDRIQEVKRIVQTWRGNTRFY